MGVPSWMVRRFPRGGRGVDDEVKLDPKKGFVDNLREVLNNVCKRQGISEDKRIAYLNSFIRLINPGKNQNQEIGLSRDDFFHCLRPLLLHESARIRATALNLVRHFLRSKQDFASCMKLQYSFLIARSLDLKLQSDSERVQAVCVARRLLCVHAEQFPMAVARALVATATSTVEEKDRLLRAALAVLVELCLLNPDTFITAGGVTALTRNLCTITMSRMAESMLGALLFLLNKPSTRARALIDLECVAAPYTDPSALGGGAKGAASGQEGRRDWVLVSLLRAWPGVLHFCHPQKEGLWSLVATLHLNQHEVRRSLIDLFYEVLNIPQPEWSDEPQVALEAVDPSRYQDAYRLGEGFVAAEGRAVLPHCSRTRVNLQEVHLSLLLYSFLEAGILDAIVEVIVSDDSFLSVRATILLGEILHLTHLLLPPECCHVTPVLPTLVSYAVRGRRTATNCFGAKSSSSSAHYERFRRQMQQEQQERKKENGGGGVEKEEGRGKRERRRTVSGQSCRSRTVSDSSGDRSRLDRDSVSAQADPVLSELYSSGEPKNISKATSLLRDIQSVLKDNTTAGDDNYVGQHQGYYDEKMGPDFSKVAGDYDKVGPEYDKIGCDDDKVVRDYDKVGHDYGKLGHYYDKVGHYYDKVGPDYAKFSVFNNKVGGDYVNSNFWEPGLQPLPEFFEKGEIFETEDNDNQDWSARYPVDEPFSIRVQQRALTAVSTLTRLHRLLRKRPAPSSIFLDHLITSIDKKQTPTSSELARAKGKTASKSKLAQLLNKESEETIKDSGVLVVKDPFSWNWDIIRSILKGKTDMSSETNRLFLKKLLQFFLPSSRQLMRIDVGSDRRIANIYTMTALDFLDCLLSNPKDVESEKMLYELVGNISTEICQVKSSPHSCLLSPQNVGSTLCSDYFLYIGHLSRTEIGRNVLEKTGVFKLLLELISSTNLDCYVRLVISTLDYTETGFARKIMEAALKSNVVSFRLYATKLLHVLLRTPMQDCKSMIDWVIVSLIERVADTDSATGNVAVEALDEACDCVEYLRSVVKMFPVHLLEHSDVGLMLVVRVMSTADGFVRMLEEGVVKKQLEYWGEEFNQRYVCVVEGRLCDSLTLHERNEDGTYCGRVSGVKRSPNDVFVPAHLYGQLVQHEAGFKMLIGDEYVKRMVETVLDSNSSTDAAVASLKAAIWAVGAVAGWPMGARWLGSLGVGAALVRLAERCPVYSVRGTAFYALSQMATNEDGAQCLREGGWHITRHNRHERWPVLVKLDLMEDVVVNDDDEQDTSQDSSSCDLPGDDPNATLGRGHFYLPLDTDDQQQLDSADQLIRQLNESSTDQLRQRRAATLPAGSRLQPGSAAAGQHTRSYSESKAEESPRTGGGDSVDSRASLSIEGLRKNRPSSCDISSGSSTDSVSQQYSKYNVGDRIQTLSPIPSSGSLTTIKYPAVTNPRSRRTSVTNSTSSHKSARLSQQDAQGYATLRFLHRGRRPLLSNTPTPTTITPHLPPPPSPLSPIDQLLGADLRRQISPLVRPKRLHHSGLSAVTSSRAAEFDAGHGSSDWQHVLSDVTSPGQTLMPAYQSSRSCIARGSDASGGEESSWSGPTYLGICLPHNLTNLFPSDDLPHNRRPAYAVRPDTDTQLDADNNNSSADSETDTGTDSGGGGGGGASLSVGGAFLAAATTNGRRRRHDRQNCMLCTSNRAANQRVSRLRKVSSSSTHRTRTETESSYGAANEGESPIMLPWQNRACGGLEGVNSVDSSSTDAASIVHRSPMDNMRSRSMVRRDILKLACQLANPVLYKTCKQALLQLKQLYNDLFQDICVYSDVCAIIANSMHRIQARRFLQELFLDIPFTELYEDAITLLSSSNGGGENGDQDYDQLMLSSGDQLLANQLTGSADDGSDANAGAANFRPAKSGTKSAFNDEQRSNPLLEVIPEHDARSDSSGCLSQSMLNLSDFSAPNSFDANDGVMMSSSYDRKTSSQNTATSLLPTERPRLHSASSAYSYTKPMILRTLTNSATNNQTTNSDALLSKTSTSLPSSSSISSQRPSRRSLSMEKETEKAKQLIELSTSKISVLQEALKQTSPTLSASSSSGSSSVTHQVVGHTLSSSSATGDQVRGSTLSPSSSWLLAASNHVGGSNLLSFSAVTIEDRGLTLLSSLATSVQEKGPTSSSSSATTVQEKGPIMSLSTSAGINKVKEQVTNERRGVVGSADLKSALENVDLEGINQKKDVKNEGLETAVHEKGLKDVDLEGTSQRKSLGNKDSVDKEKESKDVVSKCTSQKKDFTEEDSESADCKKLSKDTNLGGSVQKVMSEKVDFGDGHQTKASENVGSSSKSNLEISSKPEVDQSSYNLELEIESIPSSSVGQATKTDLSERKLVENLVSIEEKITVDCQTLSGGKTVIDSTDNFGNELSNKDPNISKGKSSKTVAEYASSVKISDSLQRLSEIEKASLKSILPLKSVGDVSKEGSSIKDLSTGTKIESVEQSSKDLSFGSSYTKSDDSSLKSESSSKFDSSLKSVSSSKVDSSSKSEITAKGDSSSKDSSSKKDSPPSKLGSSSSKSDSSPLKAGKTKSASSKSESVASKLEASSSKPELFTSKSESGSSRLDSSTSKSGSIPSKPESSVKSESVSSKSENLTASKPSKESKTSIRGKRLKSQLNTGPSLLSTSPSTSTSPSSSSKASTKLTPKRSDDVTGPGSENTKPTTTGAGSENTKPTKSSDSENTKPSKSSESENTKPKSSDSENTKPKSSDSENTKLTTGSGSDSTKPTVGVKSQRQRKKATSKEPNRESLELGKK